MPVRRIDRSGATVSTGAADTIVTIYGPQAPGIRWELGTVTVSVDPGWTTRPTASLYRNFANPANLWTRTRTADQDTARGGDPGDFLAVGDNLVAVFTNVPAGVVARLTLAGVEVEA